MASDRHLRLLGIQTWQPRDTGTHESAPRTQPQVAEATPQTRAEAEYDTGPPPGLDVPQPLTTPEPPAPADTTALAEVGTLAWEALEARAAECRACELCESRTKVVFGVGNKNADWLVIGEAPGAEEDRRGEPFVGRAGKLLDAMLIAAGCSRESVYIANILKCRPPNNRDPRQDESRSCRPFLDRQIALLKPKLILAVGRIAAQQLLGSDSPVGKLRGSLHHYGPSQVPLIVTYHPAYLLRSPSQKRKSWDDLQRAMVVAQGREPDKPLSL